MNFHFNLTIILDTVPFTVNISGESILYSIRALLELNLLKILKIELIFQYKSLNTFEF
jgi:hypothetical protein